MEKWKLVQDYRESIKIFGVKLRNVSPHEITGLTNWIEYKNMVKAAMHLADYED